MDFDKPKVYGDTSIADGLVHYYHHYHPQSEVMAGKDCYEMKRLDYGKVFFFHFDNSFIWR